jgi:hypothetical protein
MKVRKSVFFFFLPHPSPSVFPAEAILRTLPQQESPQPQIQRTYSATLREPRSKLAVANFGNAGGKSTIRGADTISPLDLPTSSTSPPSSAIASPTHTNAAASAFHASRIVPDQACPIYTLDGNKRVRHLMFFFFFLAILGSDRHSFLKTFMMKESTLAQDVITDFLGKYSLEALVSHCVLTSVVKDAVSVVRNSTLLKVKNKWPLIVSSNKSEIPKCRFVIRCLVGSPAQLIAILGQTLVIKDGAAVV